MNFNNARYTLHSKGKPTLIKYISKYWMLYLMTLPGLIFFFLFSYLPMAGIIVAFKEFNISEGIFGSPWIHPLTKNFEFFVTSDQAWRATKNTLILNALMIIIGIIFEVGIAIILNELKNKYFKKMAQSMVLLPYFVSWIVVSMFTYAIFNADYGALNNLLKLLELSPVDWYNSPGYWPAIMVALSKWKISGYNSIIYLAVLSSIDLSYYESARIDGASTWEQIWHISIPQLAPTITTLTLFSIGRIMNADFGMFYSVVGENSLLYPTVDVIDTYIYRSLRKLGDVGMSSAAGLFQSVVAFILVLVSNGIARKYQKAGSIF